MDKDGWKKTRKYRKSEKFGFKISARNSFLPSLQSAYCVWLNAAPDTYNGAKILATSMSNNPLHPHRLYNKYQCLDPHTGPVQHSNL